MTGRFSCLRISLAVLACTATAAQASAVFAASPENSKALENHFASQGTVEYFLPTPLGGPEMGAAVIRDGSGFAMQVAEMQNGRPVSRFSERISEYNGKRPFTFLLTGKQFLSYPTRRWTDGNGVERELGDLRIYDMTGETPQVLFELTNVADLSFQAKGALTASNLLWQPADHYLNQPGIYPQKYNYFIVRQDETGNYDIFHHLQLLPDNGMVESARFNNRGIYYYQRGDLANAIATMSNANIVTDRDQSVIFTNMDFLKSEMTDIEYQAEHYPESAVDEARMYFWTGQYQAALRVLETRQRRMSDSDLAISALCMARLKRWPEADNITALLKQRGVDWLGDYLADLVTIAEMQKLPRVVEVQLRAMEALAPNHPALVAAKARILEGAGQMGEAQRLLEGYLARRVGMPSEEAVYELYGIYFNTANQAGMDRLFNESARREFINLHAYVNLKDYRDFSVVMEELEQDQNDFIKSPDSPLDDITLQ